MADERPDPNPDCPYCHGNTERRQSTRQGDIVIPCPWCDPVRREAYTDTILASLNQSLQEYGLLLTEALGFGVAMAVPAAQALHQRPEDIDSMVRAHWNTVQTALRRAMASGDFDDSPIARNVSKYTQALELLKELVGDHCSSHAEPDADCDRCQAIALLAEEGMVADPGPFVEAGD